jgi:hypothetical protein
MTLKLIEVLLVGLLVIFSLLIWRRSFTHNLKAIIYRLLRLLLTYGAGWFAFKWGMAQGYGPIISGLGATVAGFVVLFILGFILKPGADEDDEKRSLPNKLFQRMGNLVLILLLWAAAAVTVDLAATIIEQSKWRSSVYENSWLLHRVMDWHDTTAAELDTQSPNPLLDKLQQTREWLYDKAGFGHLLEQVDAVAQIQQMQPTQRAALMNQDDNLKQLLENPDMLKVIHSTEIQELIQKAGKGDGAALMQLSKHPDINKLFSDPQLYKQIMNINPRKLVKQQQKNDDE